MWQDWSDGAAGAAREDLYLGRRRLQGGVPGGVRQPPAGEARRERRLRPCLV